MGQSDWRDKPLSSYERKVALQRAVWIQTGFKICVLVVVLLSLYIRGSCRSNSIESNKENIERSQKPL